MLFKVFFVLAINGWGLGWVLVATGLARGSDASLFVGLVLVLGGTLALVDMLVPPREAEDGA